LDYKYSVKLKIRNRERGLENGPVANRLSGTTGLKIANETAE